MHYQACVREHHGEIRSCFCFFIVCADVGQVKAHDELRKMTFTFIFAVSRLFALFSLMLHCYPLSCQSLRHISHEQLLWLQHLILLFVTGWNSICRIPWSVGDVRTASVGHSPSHIPIGLVWSAVSGGDGS